MNGLIIKNVVKKNLVMKIVLKIVMIVDIFNYIKIDVVKNMLNNKIIIIKKDNNYVVEIKILIHIVIVKLY